MSMRHLAQLLLAVIILFFSAPLTSAAEPAPDLNEVVSLVPADYRHVLVQRLSLAEEKRDEWLSVIVRAQPAHREAVAFLLVNMPERDLRSLTADFLLRNVELAYEARAKFPWASAVPHEMFLDSVLPYCCLTERREDWRSNLKERIWPLVKDCKTLGEAALILNRPMFKELNVRYHATKRPKALQSPAESIEATFASCTGLSVLMVDACRTVGIPARLTGTPLWSNKSGNHTWVEVWDGQWKFLGAAESSQFNQAWFGGMAASADDTKPEHRIYSTSFRRTEIPFIMAWDPRNTTCSAVNVTGYYVHRQKLKVTVTSAKGGSAGPVVEVRQGDRLIARSQTPPAEFELAAEADYQVSTILPGDRKIEQKVRLTKGADLSIELGESTATTKPSPAMPQTSLSSDLEGDWARMKTITPRGYVCRRAPAPLTIDGKADEPAWADAPWTADFVDIEGDRKPAPRFRTRAKLLWDDENLYIFAELEEPHVWGTITKKNDVIFQDNDFEVFLGPAGSNHNYYELEINPLNTIWELTLDKPYRDGGPARSPANIDGLKSAVHVNGTLNNPADTDRSWCVELAIPWKGIPRDAGRPAACPKDGEQWRANFSRVEWLVDIIDGKYRKIPREMRPEDNWVWSPQGVVDMHRPERWGFLQFSASAETAKFRPDPTLSGRDALMTVYHRQQNFHKQFGKYAASPAELGLGCQLPDVFGSIEMTTTAGGYIATTRIAGRDGKARILHVREDSKLWEE